MPEDAERDPNEAFKKRLKSFFTPPDPQRQKQALPPKARFSIWYFLIIFLLLTLVQNYFLAPTVETIPYSRFKQEVAEGNVNNLVIGPDRISGKLKGKGEKAEQNFVTVRVEDPNLIKELDERKISYSGLYESKFLSNLLSWVIPLAFFFFIWRFAMKRMGPGYGVMSFSKSKAKVFAEHETKVTFDDVAGIDEAKEELQEVVEFLKNPGKFRKLGGRIPKGVLLVGPPGTGKTLLAKAVAGEAGVPFFSISGSEFVEMFVGVGAARVRDLFSQASGHAPCIIFIDELDALGKARGINVMGGHDEREQTLNQLLVEMDGFESNKGVIIMAATNRPEILDPALLRPGRFDRHVAIDKPDIRGREAILRIHTKGVKLGPEVDITKIATMTPGFVGADLANLVNEAALCAARHNREHVTMADFQEAADRIIGGLEKKNRAMNPHEKEVVAYHESGHALVAMIVPYVDPVHKISIIPRGIGALGYTQQLPTEDRYLMTRQELENRLQVLLGGRVAEEIVFGDISTGAQNDLQRATDIARSMVMEYGMSEELGPLTYTSHPRSPYLEIGGRSSEREYSELTAQKIDEEVSRIVTQAHERVILTIQKHRESLECLAKTLLEREVMEGEELQKFAEAVRERASLSGEDAEGREPICKRVHKISFE